MIIKLSPRELEVVKLVAKGYMSKEIARELNISMRTVGAHRYNAMIKTDTQNAVELTNFYYNELEK